MQDCVEVNDKNCSLLIHLESRTLALSSKLGSTTLSYAKRMNFFEKQIKELDILVHKPSNFMKTLRQETDNIYDRIMKKMTSLEEKQVAFAAKHDRDMKTQ